MSTPTDIGLALARFEDVLKTWEKDADVRISSFGDGNYGRISEPIKFSNEGGYKISTAYEVAKAVKGADGHISLNLTPGESKVVPINKPVRSITNITGGRKSATEPDTYQITVEYDDGPSTVVQVKDVKNCRGPEGEANSSKPSSRSSYEDGAFTVYGADKNLKWLEFSATGYSNSFKGFSGSITGGSVGVTAVKFSFNAVDLSYSYLYSLVVGASFVGKGVVINAKLSENDLEGLQDGVVAALDSELELNEDEKAVVVSEVAACHNRAAFTTVSA